MPVLMYRDPLDGQMKPLIGGNKVVDNFQASDDQPTDPNIDLWLDTDDNTTGQIVQTMSGVNSATHLADYKGAAPSVTGYLLITIPDIPFAMMNLKVTGYNYSSVSGAMEFMIGGYTYRDGPSWINTSASANGKFPGSVQYLDVRYLFAGNTSNATFAIAIGSVGTVWNYPQLVLSGISGFSGAAVIATTGWGLSITTDISAWTTNATKQMYSGRIWQGTQAEYDAITTKDSQILYVVNG